MSPTHPLSFRPESERQRRGVESLLFPVREMDRVERALLPTAFDIDLPFTQSRSRTKSIDEKTPWKSGASAPRKRLEMNQGFKPRWSRSRLNCSFTTAHSAATIEYRTESRGIKSAAMRWARRIPSNFPPMRLRAARERWL